MNRLRILVGWLAAIAIAAPAATPYPVVRPFILLRFPADHGAHPQFRTEWWYVTGWLKTPEGQDLGFQITFFRSRQAVDAANPSKFAPGQILFAHAAISDPATGKLRHASGGKSYEAAEAKARKLSGEFVEVLIGWVTRVNAV